MLLEFFKRFSLFVYYLCMWCQSTIFFFPKRDVRWLLVICEVQEDNKEGKESIRRHKIDPGVRVVINL